MSTDSAILGVSLLLKLSAAVWPVGVYLRTRAVRVLALSLLGLVLFGQGVATLDSSTPWLSLALGATALILVVVACHVFVRRLSQYEDLRQSETLNRLTLSSVSDAVFIADDEGRITHLWKGASRLFGLPDGHSGAGLSVGELVPGLELDLETLARDGVLANVPVSVRRPHGSRQRLLVTAKKVDIQGGTVLYICRDVTETSRMETALERALEEVRTLKDRFEAEALYLQDEIRTEHNVRGIIGASPELRRMLETVESVADTESTVLIRGETGAGKELVARAIHDLSSRSDRPLVKVNCAALPTNLVESELFGHEKGAFTGAVGQKKGRFELAHRGSLFLDEIGELPLELQPKLLRVLQEGEFERVGGTETIRVDVRLLAATNRDLKKEVEDGRFRADLYYRLEVFPIVVPPLRDRKDDIPVLAHHFLEEVSGGLGRSFDGFTRASVDAMRDYDWPGNVRELRNVVERAAIVAQGPNVDAVPFLGLAPGRSGVGAGGGAASDRLEDVERSHILQVLERVGWQIEGQGGAAEVLDMNPSTLRARLRKLGLRRPTA